MATHSDLPNRSRPYQQVIRNEKLDLAAAKENVRTFLGKPVEVWHIIFGSLGIVIGSAIVHGVQYRRHVKAIKRADKELYDALNRSGIVITTVPVHKE